MGLSEGERLGGIYYTVNRLNKLNATWKKDYRNKYTCNNYQVFHDLLDKLWATFLKDFSNTGFIKGNNAPWDIALEDHLENALREPWDFNEKGPDDDIDRKAMLKTFHTLEFPYREIYNVYQECENIVYYLRRYFDEFLTIYQPLSDLVSQLMGECFAFFEMNDAFAKSHLIEVISEFLFSIDYPYSRDNIDLFIDKQNLQHQIKPSFELKELVKFHTELVEAKVLDKLEPQRKEVLIRICYQKFEYSKNDFITQFPEFTDLINELAEKYKEEKKKDSQKYKKDHAYDLLSEYGHEGNIFMYKVTKKKKAIDEGTPVEEKSDDLSQEEKEEDVST